MNLRKIPSALLTLALAFALGCGDGNKVELPKGTSPPPKLEGGPATKPGNGGGAGQTNLPPPPPPVK